MSDPTGPRREPWMVDGDPRLDPIPVCPHPHGTRDYEEWWEGYFRLKIPLLVESNRREAATQRECEAADYGHDFAGRKDPFAARDKKCPCGQCRMEFVGVSDDEKWRDRDRWVCPLVRGPVYFLDCYHHGALLGDRFPVNTFGPADYDKLLWLRAKIGAQFDRTEITRETKGQSPVDEPYWPGVERPR